MMKQILICLFFLTVLNLSAQEKDNFSIGPKIGINFANVTNKDTKINPGLALGLTSTYSINESSGIGLDLLFSQQGFKSGGFTIDLNYIKVPLVYKLFFNKLGDAFRPRLEVGVSPGLLLSASTNGIDAKPAYNNFEMGWIGGLGFNYRLSNRIWLNVDLRADLGITNLSDSSIIGVPNLKNRTIGLNVGFAYGL